MPEDMPPVDEAIASRLWHDEEDAEAEAGAEEAGEEGAEEGAEGVGERVGVRALPRGRRGADARVAREVGQMSTLTLPLPIPIP